MNVFKTALAILLLSPIATRPAQSAELSLGTIQTLQVYTPGDGRPSQMRAGDSAVVWDVGFSSSTSAIHGYDFQQGMPRVIRSTDGRSHLQPDTSGRTVVWSEDEGATRNIYSFNLDSEHIQPLTTGGKTKTYPSMDGNVLSWDQFGANPRDVYAAISPDWIPFPVAASLSNYESLPDVDAGRIFFSQTDGMRLYDADNMITQSLDPTAATFPDRPQIKGDYVAWRRGDDVQVENLISGDRLTIPDSGHFSLGDDLLVYYDHSSTPDSLVAIDLTDGSRSVLRTIDSDSRGRGHQTLFGKRLTWIEVQFGSFNQDTYTIYSAEVIIPEPSTLLLATLAACGMLVRRRR